MAIKTLIRECPLCGKNQSQTLLTKKERSYARCLSCGLVYQDPLPTAEERRQYYASDYYSKLAGQTSFIQQARSSIFTKALSEFAAYRRTGRILDVGSGMGDFLRLAQGDGWDAWGIEPSSEACEVSRKWLGDKVFNQTVKDAEFPSGYFDVITIWNVLDCFIEPLEAVRCVHEWLVPGGLLVIRTPNTLFHLQLFRTYSALRTVLEKIGWEKDVTIFHEVNYDARSLKWLLGKAGFSDVRIANSDPTRGDPYRCFSRQSLVDFLKNSMAAFSAFMHWITAGRFLISSSLMAYAVKNPAGPETKTRALQARIFFKKVPVHLLAVLGYGLGLPLWFKLLGYDQKIRILLYHSVDPAQQGGFNVFPDQFERQLDFLACHYDVISLDEVLKNLSEGKTLPRRTVAITFDDGYEDNYRHAFPLLRRKNFEAAVFLLTGEHLAGKNAVHIPEEYRSESRLLSWNQIREMSAGAVTFGSHGENHTRMKTAPPDVLLGEVGRSKKKIEAEIGKEIQFFSYPYGTQEDFDAKTQTCVKDAGYRAAVSALYGMNDAKSDLYALSRIGIDASDTLFTFRAKLNGALALTAFFNQPWLRRIIRWADRNFFEKTGKESEAAPLLLVSVDFPPHTDGVSTISKELIERIVAAGKEILALAPQDSGDKEYDAKQSFRTYRVPGYYWGHWRFLPILCCMPYLVFRRKVKKIFAMNIAYGGLIAWLLSFLKPLDYVIFAYGYEFEKVKNYPLVSWLYRKIYGRAKEIVACSQKVKEKLICFGVREDKIKVLYPAVNLGRYYPKEVPQQYLEEKGLAGRKIILTVGRLVLRKGHDKILEALPDIISQFPEVLYVIVGIGDQEEKLRRKVHELGLKNHVRFLGKVPPEELPRLYNACEVFVMPSREIEQGGHIEGFGIVFLEANACGKPVIGGNSGGVVEAIQDGRTGYLVNPLSAEDITGKILQLFAHPDQAKTLGEKGLEWVRKSFNWDDYVAKSYFGLMNEGLS